MNLGNILLIRFVRFHQVLLFGMIKYIHHHLIYSQHHYCPVKVDK